MTPLALACALLLFMSFADRLRQICWCSAQPRFVFLYLLNLLWSLSLIYDVMTGMFCLAQFVGIAAMAALLHATQPNWADGMPSSFRRGRRAATPPDL